MARKGGWRREGSRRHFRYVDASGRRITDAEKLERIESLVIPPAWRDVWISPRPDGEAPGDRRRRRGPATVPLPPDYRPGAGKYDKLIRFAERLPDIRAAMAEHLDGEELTADWYERARRPADQPRLVPRRRRPLREAVAHLRDHDADASATSTCAAAVIVVQVPRQAQGLGPRGDRRRRARRGDPRAARTARAGDGSSATSWEGELATSPASG